MSDPNESLDPNAADRGKAIPDAEIPRGDDAGIQSATTTGGDRSDERPTSPGEGPVTDEERRTAGDQGA